jgi:hypothetical protein
MFEGDGGGRGGGGGWRGGDVEVTPGLVVGDVGEVELEEASE